MCAIGAAAGVWLYSQLLPVVDFLDDGQRDEVVASTALGVLMFLALLGTGIWNLAARRTWAIAPLVTAVIVSGGSFVFSVINAIDLAISMERRPIFWAAWVYLGLVILAVGLLRLKPTPVVSYPRPPGY
ncbi:hypothetical protein BIU82_16040 [Arthrobacter sp. SW1]|uniref:hypothetical protein n=1 Tax=Arthrobacter sp. SW1 TaxID=1920889 RepID=UPI000877D904|nr:hypothetical protein [Arthrobacter sp. SW1]OFI39148.1 hypothetical protein BIU82_16040 [Arthrobacter sp. SW1]